MNFYLVLLHLAGAVMLMLWAVRMVRTGVERSQEPALKELLRESRGGRLRAAFVGMGTAILLQSSTAVALLAAGFAASGALSLATGLAMMLGADLGSAIVVQILSIDLEWLVPVLLLVGGLMFFKGSSRQIRQGGRIALGIALILVALQMISQATLPLRQSPALGSIVNYLQSDYISTFLLGAAFTWLVHSSVASILMVITFATQGLIPLEVAVTLVLGANLGGGLIALGLTRNSAIEARRIAVGNLIFRGTGAVLALIAFQVFQPPLAILGDTVAKQLLHTHLSFNALLLVLCLPLTGPVAALATRLVKSSTPLEQSSLELGSCLDFSVLDKPALALASAKREVVRMAEMTERMFKPIMELYADEDEEKVNQIRQLEQMVDSTHKAIKNYLAQIRYTEATLGLEQRGQELASFAINFEFIGDAISKNLVKSIEQLHANQLKFSPSGWYELTQLHHRVLQNMHMALNVLMSEDRASARLLVIEKTALREAERASSLSHLNRLRAGATESIETSNIHLETVHTLKLINSLFTSVAYPILAESGDLLDSRLIDEASSKATKAANKAFNPQEVPAAALATVKAPSI